MKRPIPVYFIAGWSFLVLTVQTRALARLGESYLSNEQDPDHLWGAFRGFLLILVIWHVVRLIQIKPFNRWLSFVSLGWATISTVVFMFIMSQRVENPFRIIMTSSISGLLSLTSALYLAHPRFRKYAVRFVTEREREKNSRIMQRISQKKVLDEIDSC